MRSLFTSLLFLQVLFQAVAFESWKKLWNPVESPIKRVLNAQEADMLLELIQLTQTIATGYDVVLTDGALLGALRHHDFTPWDDDVDLGIIIKNPDDILKLHDRFDQYTNTTSHHKYGRLGKTQRNLSPYCWRKQCKLKDPPPLGRPFLGVFRLYFLTDTRSRWIYTVNCSKKHPMEPQCPRYPLIEIFLLQWKKEQLSTVVGWKTVPLSKAEVYPLRPVYFHGKLIPTFQNPYAFIMKKYKFANASLERFQCTSGTNHRTSSPMRPKINQPCSDLFHLFPFVRVRNRSVEVAFQGDRPVSMFSLDTFNGARIDKEHFPGNGYDG
jgi:hypothetical protein